MGRNRKELDKESMFKKIMPSAAEVSVEYPAAAELRQAVAEQQIAVAADRTAAASAPATQQAVPVTVANAAPAPEAMPAAEPLPSVAAAPVAVAQAEAPVAAPTQGSQQVLNAPILNAPVLNAAVFAPSPAQDPSGRPLAEPPRVPAEQSISVAPGVAESAPISPVASPMPIAAPVPAAPIPAPEPVAPPAPQEAVLEEPVAPENYTLVNLSRIVMEEKQESAMDKFHCCKCEKCSMDVLAIALNKVKPQYVMVKEGQSPVSYVNASISREIVTALVQSILIVKANPRH